MADNPIRHDEIIQPGNPFEKTNKGIELLIKNIKLLEKQLKGPARELLKTIKDLNMANKQSQTVLKKAATETKKLSVAEKELDKLKKQLIRDQAKLNQMNTQEYKDLIRTREAAKAKNAELRRSAKAMAGGAKNTNKWSKALGSFQFKFNALGNIMANVTSFISRKFTQAIRGAIDVILDFDQAMADTRAIARSTDTQFKKLRDSAKALGGTTKFTATQVAQLQKEYAKLGFSTDEILGAQAATLALAAATNSDLARAAEVAGITIRQFGLKAKETQRVVDVMALSFSTSALTMEKFAESMKFVGPAAKASGLSIEETTARLAQMADAGIAGSLGGTALRQIFIAMATEGHDAAERIKELSLSQLGLADASAEVQRRAATALLVLADGADTVDDLAESFRNAGGAAQEMADVMLDTVRGQAIIVQSAWARMIQEMAETEDNMAGTKKGLKGLTTILNGITFALQNNIKFAHGIVVQSMIDKVTEGLGKEAFTLKDLKDGWQGLGRVFKEMGKNIYEQLFPIESSPLQELEDIDNLVRKLIDETLFKEEDQEAVMDNWKTQVEFLTASTKQKAQAMLDAKAKEVAGVISADDEMAKNAAAAEDEKQAKIQATFDLANRLTSTFTQLFATQKAKELSMVGDNAEKRAEIEKKFAQKEQFLSISQAIIDGASSILKTKASLGMPLAIPFMIADAAITAAQIGIMASRKFAEGGSGLLDDSGGILQGQSHAQGGVDLGAIGEAERGEYFGIINKRMTQKYGNELPGIFDSINNGAFHEVWGRTGAVNANIGYNDPYTKKMYEAMMNTPTYPPEGKRTERYPSGRTRIING